MKHVIIVNPKGKDIFVAAEYATRKEALEHLPEFAAQYGEGCCFVRRVKKEV